MQEKHHHQHSDDACDAIACTPCGPIFSYSTCWVRMSSVGTGSYVIGVSVVRFIEIESWSVVVGMIMRSWCRTTNSWRARAVFFGGSLHVPLLL